MASTNLAVSRLNRADEIDLYLAYEDASRAGDAVRDEGEAAPDAASRDASFDPALSTEAEFSSTETQLYIPESVLKMWRETPPNWPRALPWPPKGVIETIEETARDKDYSPILGRAARGEPVTKEEWTEVQIAFNEALGDHDKLKDRQIDRAHDLAVFLSGLTPPSVGPDKPFHVVTPLDVLPHNAASKVGFACLFALAGEGEKSVSYDYRNYRQPPEKPEGDPPGRGQKQNDEWEDYMRRRRMYESVWRASFDRLETHDGGLLKVTRDDGLACSRITPQAARLFVEEAMARGWDRIVVRGGDKFIQAIEQAAREFPDAPPIVIGHKPTYWELIPFHPARNMREFAAAPASPFDKFGRINTPNIVEKVLEGDILDAADPGPRSSRDANMDAFAHRRLHGPGGMPMDDDIDVTGFVNEQMRGPDENDLPSIEHRRSDDGPSP